MGELMARTVSAALHRLGFNPVSKRGRFDGLTVSGKGRVRVSATWADQGFAWEMIGLCADALESAGWTVERRQAPAFPGLYVTAAPVRGAKSEETGMMSRQVPAVGDVVTICGEHVSDGVTRVGTVEQVSPYSESLKGHLLTLRSVRVETTWVDTWNPDTMIVARVGDCGHEVTGGYVYTGDPAGSRSMTLDVVKVNDLDEGGLWLTAHDPEGMEVEVMVKGVTLAAIDRLTDRPVPARDAQGLLRALMSGYLDRRTAGQWGGSEEILTQAVMLAYGWSQDRAGTWLAEELQDMAANRD